MNGATYKIIYDLDRDIWNWYYGSNYSDNGSQLTESKDKQILKGIVGLSEIELAEPILCPFLRSKLSNKNSELNEFIKISKSEFDDKFYDACDILEKITNRPLAVSKFTFYITTFPRMVVFFDEGIIFMYAKIDKKLWGMPIDGFLHESLHFQFNKYWRENEESLISKLSEDDYFMIKESLTVILDEELKPTITLPDCSYPEFFDYRKALHDNWKKHHDFDRLVDYGLEKLSEYTNKS